MTNEGLRDRERADGLPVALLIREGFVTEARRADGLQTVLEFAICAILQLV